MRHAIAIIGGGPAGVSALTQLVDSFVRMQRKKITIYLIEKSDQIGPGLPYSTQEKNHILNIASDFMSPIPNRPEMFIEWLKQFPGVWKTFSKELNFKKLDIEKNKFPPRALFGRLSSFPLKFSRVAFS